MSWWHCYAAWRLSGPKTSSFLFYAYPKKKLKTTYPTPIQIQRKELLEENEASFGLNILLIKNHTISSQLVASFYNISALICGKAQDLPGVKYHIIREKLQDLNMELNNQNNRELSHTLLS
ncbi:hypothetical protein THRCLA_21233 [Thraustotheca clavata]|uniref:Uncharacterized protein n=1 Tax=Thraustotheca clavata TaxID=74557 RepID=A0A1V9ZYM8_9STRA|nr:hypothetical protein THRCLA_21233 [Thraustotheca clavata]